MQKQFRKKHKATSHNKQIKMFQNHLKFFFFHFYFD